MLASVVLEILDFFPLAGATAYQTDSYVYGGLRRFSCNGSESNLTDCQFTYSGHNGYSAGIKCCEQLSMVYVVERIYTRHVCCTRISCLNSLQYFINLAHRKSHHFIVIQVLTFPSPGLDVVVIKLLLHLNTWSVVPITCRYRDQHQKLCMAYVLTNGIHVLCMEQTVQEDWVKMTVSCSGPTRLVSYSSSYAIKL